MELLELPREILHIFLFHAILNRGMKRALRLRLVCKTFAEGLYPALFETRIMDDFPRPAIGSDVWQIQSQHGADKLWHDYLVLRVMDNDASIGRCIEIQQIAKCVCQETGHSLDLHATVKELCWLACAHRTAVGKLTASGIDLFKWWGPKLRESNHPKLTKSNQRPTSGLNTLLSAAAYLDLVPLAKRLLAEGHNPASHNYLFAPPIQVAAQAGNFAMLQLFQEHLPGFQPVSLLGASIRSDIRMVKLALQLPVRTKVTEENGGNMRNQGCGSIDWLSEMGRAILDIRGHTSSPEVYDYLTSLLTPWPMMLPNAYDDLRKYAELGNILMVRHLLHLGVPIQFSGPRESPLTMACRGWHNDIVDILLEHGADPNYAGQKVYPVYPLHQSATAGSLSIARKFLDRRALPNRPGGMPDVRLPVLSWATERQH